MMEPKSFNSDIEITSFINDYCTFNKDEIYLLIAMARPKENDQITSSNQPTFKEIITDKKDIRRKYFKLKAIAENYIPEEGGDLKFRIYLSANPRNIDKSFYLFKQKLLEHTYNKETGHYPTIEKIKRLDREWISILQKDGSKLDSRFIIDIDRDESSLYKDTYNMLEETTEIIDSIKSPNGYHIITEPFDYPRQEFIMDNNDIEIDTDGLLFIELIG